MDYAGPISTGIPTANYWIVLFLATAVVVAIVWWKRHDD